MTPLALPLLLLSLALAPGPGNEDVQPPSAAARARFTLTDFYGQCVYAGDLPVVASPRVEPTALLEARFLITKMIGHRPELLTALADNDVRFTVMAHDEWTTDVPEHADLRPARYWDRRARGLGASAARPSVSCGEENLLAFPGDPYAAENILIHEFAHAIHLMGLSSTDPSFGARLSTAYRSAMDEGLWKGTYAASNPQEYWAEGVQSYFDTNRENDHDHGKVDTREELILHDLALFELCAEVFGREAWRYVHPSERLGEGHLAAWAPQTAPTFAWPADMLAAYQREERERAVRQKPGEDEVAFDRRRAEAGGVSSMIELGLRLRDGRGVERDPAQALRWVRAAAETGDAEALDHLGWALETGLAGEVDLPAAVRCYRRAAAGRNAQGRFNLGRMLREGRGVPGPDPVFAAMWLELAARTKHPAATAMLKDMGPEELCAADRERARRLASAWR